MLPFQLLLSATFALAVSGAWGATDKGAPLATFTVKAEAAFFASSVDAEIEAVRDATVSTQVQGAVTAVHVKAGDRVVAGQELVRIDARAAQQSAAASAAQVDAARAAQQAAAREYERQKQLFQKDYISQAALDRAEAQRLASQAQVQALLAQAGAAATQSGFYVIKAPFAGVVGQVTVNLGDMALPGKPLMKVYDPTALRATANVGLLQAAALRESTTTGGSSVQVELASLSSARIPVPASRLQVLPTVDAQSHTVQVRAELPANLAGAAPGMFARIWMDTPIRGAVQGAMGAPAHVLIPSASVVRRSEMTGVYVLDERNRPLLRQVRLGRVAGDMVEVLTGVRAGDRIAVQPQVAAKAR